MTEKKKYEAPELEAYEVKTADVIATSIQTNDLNYDSGEYEF